jgi:hypothetical protein
MLKIRSVFVLLGMLLLSAPSVAEVSVRIGINLPVYPELIPVPGYPVYYAPRLDANYFFYDGLYWVYQDDYWYTSSWYDGPWEFVEPEFVPVFILRIPVRYYRRPPVYFRGWRSDAPPRWGDHWGRDWEQHRSGWDRWDRHTTYAPAPLPVYQRQYSKDRYPRQLQQQQELQQRNYRYQARDPVVRERYQERAVQRAPGAGGSPQLRRDAPVAPRSQSTPRERAREDVQRSAPSVPQQQRHEVQDRSRQQERGQQSPKLKVPEERQQGKDATREPKGKQDQERDRGQDQGRNRDRNRND